MSGASSQTRRVSYVNANWTAGGQDRPASFELLIVTEDEVRYALPVPSEQMAALVALTQAGSVLLWDPEDQTLVAANLVGDWIPETFSTLTSE